MSPGIEPFRLIDKAQPDRPFDYELRELRQAAQISERSFRLITALLEADPQARRSAVDSLDLEIEGSVA